jgi:hypothetical protein
MEAILNLSEVRTKRENWTYLAGFSSAIRFEKDSVIFDGKAISIYNAKDNVYATAAKEGTLDDAIKYAVVDLGLRVPLAMMFLSTFPDELEARVTAADYVETATKGIDFQEWIAQGSEPLPRRIVITYADEKGQPQFWADFSAWNLAPELSTSMHSFAGHAWQSGESLPDFVQRPSRLWPRSRR